MAEGDRGEAQRRRAEARQQRRAEQAEAAEEPQETADSGAEDESPGALGHAAKVAAAGAAVGAALGAALAARDGSPGEEAEGEQHAEEPDEQPAARHDETQQAEAQQQAEPSEQRDEGRAAEREPKGEAAARPHDDAPTRGASRDETLDVVRRAREQLQALQGREAESVSSLERTAQGWAVTLEVVELPRVPDSTDVMASYELLLDDDKNVLRFTRGRRYYRSQADRDGAG